MADLVTREKRSRMMSGIRSKDTKPEIIVRKALHARGFRYRLHVKNLPGKPDLVFRKHKAVIFVHGCFWHGHSCHLFKQPKSRTHFWEPKIEANKQRDARTYESLRGEGYRIAEVWECATKGRTRVDRASIVIKLSKWLTSDEPFLSIAGERAKI
jgi:DNA mismatch endonuclease (patch repair protein)